MNFSIFNISTKSAEINYKNIAKLAKEAGEVISVLAVSLEDGVITEKERRCCVKELLDLSQITNSLMMQLNK